MFKSVTHLRHRALRKAKVVQLQLCLYPKRRGRLEKVSLTDVIKKSEKDYVDFQTVWGPNLENLDRYGMHVSLEVWTMDPTLHQGPLDHCGTLKF